MSVKSMLREAGYVGNNKNYRLWFDQLRVWRDTRLVPIEEVLSKWMHDENGHISAPTAVMIASTKQFNAGFFYECCQEDTGYRYRGYRYGSEDEQYLSGFGR